MRKILLLALIVCLLAAPAYADFAALERSITSGNIIADVQPGYYLGQDGTALTEASIASYTTEGYSKTGLTADGNTRLILRYQAPSAGSVTFTLSANMSATQLESLTDRQPITAPVRTTQIGEVHQASAVLTAPETWPSTMDYPRDTFTVTASFIPDNGETVQETLRLTLHAPSVVLIHGTFSNAARAFGYDNQGTSSSVWPMLEKAGLSIITWNYDNLKGPKTIISNDKNTLALTLTDAFNALNAQGIASTRADMVTHSTGGLMARQFLRNDFETGNKSALSYKQGMIRRVVTIASPNRGTPIASYFLGREKFKDIGEMWQKWEGKTLWEGLIHILLNMFGNEDGKANDAFEDASINSSLIAQLGYPAIPFHSIYGKLGADRDKLAELFDIVIEGNEAKIKQLTYLPPQLIDNLLGLKGAMVRAGLILLSPGAHFSELFNVLFNGEDHDVIVPEKSAIDIFPENARTAFEGLETHNHVQLTLQGDVSSRVLELLKGDTSSFMIGSGVSAAEYDRAFDEYVTELEPKLRASTRFRASSEDVSDFFDKDMGLEVYESPNQAGKGAANEEEAYSLIDLSGSSSQVFSNDIYVLLDYGDRSKFFKMEGSNSTSFAKSLEFDNSSSGIVNVTYFTVINGELKISKTEQLVVPPQLFGVKGIKFTSSKIYVNEGDNVKLELLAQGANGNYDIAAPILGFAKYTVKDSTIASVNELGYITGLKAGTTEITARAEGRTASITVEVLPAAASSSSSSDSEQIPAENPGSSGGGCNAGFGALVVLAGCALFAKKR